MMNENAAVQSLVDIVSESAEISETSNIGSRCF